MSDAPQSLEEFAMNEANEPAEAELLEDTTRKGLDLLDKLLISDEYNDYEEEDLTKARLCVSRTMELLQKNPKLDSILISEDVRNIIRFIRLTKEKFEVKQTTKKEKAVKAAKSPANKLMKDPALQAALRSAMGFKSKEARVPSSIEAFAKATGVTTGEAASGSNEANDPFDKTMRMKKEADKPADKAPADKAPLNKNAQLLARLKAIKQSGNQNN